MRAWLLKAPWWVLALVYGTFFGAAMGLWTRFGQGAPWGVAITAGLIGGVVFGALMGRITSGQNRRLREVAGDDVESIRRAGRVAWRGPVPADPELRAAAWRLALHHRKEMVRQQRWTIPAFVLFIALEAVAAIWISPRFWFAVAFFVVMLLATLLWPVWLGRRAERLAPTADGPPRDGQAGTGMLAG